jgi:UDPglucose--hexose-1-phosphate uridylyltransferase
MDNLFACSFAYSMGVYQAPTYTQSSLAAFAQLHLAFYPPLLRSASVKKFLAGFELFAETARDITPEQAAEKLRRADGEVHWKAALAGQA